jgi:pimeloyl-ACP methyl ester carboxylesterase
MQGGKQPREGRLEGVVLARVFLQRLPAERPLAPLRVERVLQQMALRNQRVDALEQGSFTHGHGVIGLLAVGGSQSGTGVRSKDSRMGWRPAGAEPIPRRSGAAGGLAEDAAMRIHRHGDAEGQGLVLIHGLSSSHRAWQRNLQALGQGRRISVVELFSPHAGPRFRLSEQAARLADALADEPQPLAVIGHSLGGLVAMELCVRSPQLVNRLVLVDVPALPPGAPLAERARRFAQRGVAADGRSLGVVALTLLVGNPVQLMAATAVSLRADAAEAARAIQIPTLVVWGQDDAIVPVEIGRRLVALMPNARLMVIEGAAHQPHWEAPGAFHAAVIPFLAGR